MFIVALGMDAPIIVKRFPIAVFLSFAVVTIQRLTGHDEAFAIGDDLT